MSREMAVVAESLVRRYPGSSVLVLDGASLQAPAGAITAITGVSGSGKSTLLALLAGLDQPDGGTVRVGDVDLTSLSAPERAVFRRRNVGFLFQRFNLFSGLTATENVLIALRVSGQRGATALEAARRQLVALGLGDQLDRYPHELSVGQMQRVALARACVCQPAILIADEPTANVDAATKVTVLGLLRECATRSCVLVATHDAEVAACADRVCALANGQLTCQD